MEKLVLQKNHIAIWNQTLQNMLKKSNLFDIEYKEFPAIKIGKRSQNLTLMRFRGKLIGLDTWDAEWPTSKIDKCQNIPIIKDLKLIIKIEHMPNKKPHIYKKLIEKTGIKVQNWTCFPGSHFPLNCFTWENKNHKYLVPVTGPRRQKWFNYSKNKDYIYTPQCPTNRGFEKKFSDYLNSLKICKWGFIIVGTTRYKMDKKNRREIEYSSCGMPLAIAGYQPDYNFPFYPGIHYVSLKNEPTEIEKLHDIDPLPYVEASKETYENYFSPVGASKLFIKIIEQELEV